MAALAMDWWKSTSFRPSRGNLARTKQRKKARIRAAASREPVCKWHERKISPNRGRLPFGRCHYHLLSGCVGKSSRRGDRGERNANKLRRGPVGLSLLRLLLLRRPGLPGRGDHALWRSYLQVQRFKYGSHRRRSQRLYRPHLSNRGYSRRKQAYHRLFRDGEVVSESNVANWCIQRRRRCLWSGGCPVCKTVSWQPARTEQTGQRYSE